MLSASLNKTSPLSPGIVILQDVVDAEPDSPHVAVARLGGQVTWQQTPQHDGRVLEGGTQQFVVRRYRRTAQTGGNKEKVLS